MSCDKTGFSVSFNEYLKIVSNERKSEPDEVSLMEMFRSLDMDKKGYMREEELRSLLRGKAAISPEDVEEMITEYKALKLENKVENEDVIYYKGINTVPERSLRKTYFIHLQILSPCFNPEPERRKNNEF